MSAPIPLSEARKAKGKGRRDSAVAGAGANDPLEPRVRELNREFALVLVGDKALVLRECTDFDGKPMVGFMSPAAFRTWLETERVLDGETEKFVGMGDIWLKHPKRLSYRGVAFAPEGVPDGWYNLWRGFTVEPAPYYDDPRDHVRHFPTFYDHILRNVARGQPDRARWVWGWFADMIQHPTVKSGTALVLRGLQGAGKTKPGEVVGALLGPHWVLIDDPKHLVGSFNGHMSSCLLLQADEGFWAGDKTAEGKLKSLITSSVHLIERKGVDAVKIRNLVRLLITSNSDWVVPAGFEERRFAVLDVGTDNLQDREFFARIDREMDDGGRAHLLSYLLRFDLSKVDIRTIPATEALFEQKVASMSEIHSWWLDRLRDGKLLSQHGEWKGEVATDALYKGYLAAAEQLRSKARRLSKEQFGLALRKLMPARGFRANQKVWVQVYGPDGEEMHDAAGNAARRRVNGYHIPSLADCRAHFEEMVRWKVDWGDDGDTAGETADIPVVSPSGGRPGSEFDLTD